MGTVGYMSPEQVRGRVGRSSDGHLFLRRRSLRDARGASGVPARDRRATRWRRSSRRNRRSCPRVGQSASRPPSTGSSGIAWRKIRSVVSSQPRTSRSTSSRLSQVLTGSGPRAAMSSVPPARRGCVLSRPRFSSCRWHGGSGTTRPVGRTGVPPVDLRARDGDGRPLRSGRPDDLLRGRMERRAGSKIFSTRPQVAGSTPVARARGEPPFDLEHGRYRARPPFPARSPRFTARARWRAFRYPGVRRGRFWKT